MMRDPHCVQLKNLWDYASRECRWERRDLDVDADAIVCRLMVSGGVSMFHAEWRQSRFGMHGGGPLPNGPDEG